VNEELAWASIVLGGIVWFIGLFGSGKGAPGWNFRYFGLLAVFAGAAWLILH
jgi:hypothetical protein